MSLSKTLPCHLDSLMEMLNIPWPLTPRKKSLMDTRCVFYGSMLALVCMQYSTAHIKSKFLPFPPLSSALIPLSPAALVAWMDLTRRNTRLKIPTHSSEHYQSNCRASLSQAALILVHLWRCCCLMRHGRKVKIQNREGALSSLFPQGMIISRHRCW